MMNQPMDYSEPMRQREDTHTTRPFKEPVASDFSFMTVADEDSAYALQENPKCDTARLPRDVEGTVNAEGKKVILVPDFDSMTKFMLSKDGMDKRLSLYTFINNLLRRGHLSQIVGFPVLNKTIDGQACKLKDFTYWEVSRYEFIVDITVEMHLKTRKGVLICCGEFFDEFHLEAEELVQSVEEDRRGYVNLDSHLIQLYKGTQIDSEAEKMWVKNKLEQALTDPSKRKGRILAEAMGLTVIRLPIYEHKGLNSILFFEGGTLMVGADRIEKDDNGNTIIIKDDHGERMEIPANTIVINENKVEEEHEDFPIFHECYHYEKHYLAFRLQKLTCSDPRCVRMKEMPIEPGMHYKDFFLLMENQADRGASALWMPATDTRNRIVSRIAQVKSYRHKGELFETVGVSVAYQLSVPHFRMRARLIQLGYPEAKGILHYVERKRIRPFAFDPDSLRAEELTFLITPAKINNLCKENELFRELVNSQRYVYAEGHLVFNHHLFVRPYGDLYKLTDFGIENVDVCCLRFIRIYVQQNLGQYVLGRMYMDAEYVERTLFYLKDALMKPDMNNFKAKQAYKAGFPIVFKEAVDLLKSQNPGVTYFKLAEYMHMDDSTFQRALSDPKKYKNEDFVMALCLYFKLPDWISELLFASARVLLNPNDERDATLLEILRAKSCDGIDAAQEFMKENGVDPLNWA